MGGCVVLYAKEGDSGPRVNPRSLHEIYFGGGGIQEPIEVATSMVFGGRTSRASLDSLPRTPRSVSFGSGFPRSTNCLDTQNRTIRKAGIGHLAVAAIGWRLLLREELPKWVHLRLITSNVTRILFAKETGNRPFYWSP